MRNMETENTNSVWPTIKDSARSYMLMSFSTSVKLFCEAYCCIANAKKIEKYIVCEVVIELVLHFKPANFTFHTKKLKRFAFEFIINSDSNMSDVDDKKLIM